MRPALVSALHQVCALAGDVTGWQTDWTGRTTGRALAVALPASTAEVAAVLAVCRAHQARVTIAGGRTGLVAGAVPDDTVVLATNRLVGVQVDGRSVLAGAGATLAEVQKAAAAVGLAYGVDLAARDTATVGGMVSTNAGGLRVVGFGTTRAQVLGVEAVLADGSVVSRLHGLAKDATGYDLSQLLVGAEGTLAVVTAARLRLVGLSNSRQTVLAPVDSVAAAVDLVARAQQQTDRLTAAELLMADGVALVAAVTGLPPLPSAAAYVLLEAAGGLEQVVDDHALLAADLADAQRFWAYREGLTEAVSRLGVPHKLDVSLPTAALAAFVTALPAVTGPHLVHLWGHVGDGNLHVNVVGPAVDDETVDEAVLRLCADLGGSIGAEHGIGRAKVRWLGLSRSPAELAAMRAVKTAWDPTGLLNPGVLFDQLPLGSGA